MKIKGTHYRSVWLAEDGCTVEVLDQTKLPFELAIIQLTDLQLAATAIKDMWIRGAL